MYSIIIDLWNTNVTSENGGHLNFSLGSVKRQSGFGLGIILNKDGILQMLNKQEGLPKK